MNQETDPDLMLLYVAGSCDADEIARAEALLSAAKPAACAAYAEAVVVFNALPLCLTPVEPPAACRQAILGRIAADLSNPRQGDSVGLASRLRWPIYISSGLAAALAVALTVSLWNSRAINQRNEQLAASLAGSESVLRSPHVSLASMQSQDQSDKKIFGRVLFCPESKKYQVLAFGLPQLPADKAYTLWLIMPDGQKMPAGVFKFDENGVAMVMAQLPPNGALATNAAITVEPATGSRQPTGSVRLVGALRPAN